MFEYRAFHPRNKEDSWSQDSYSAHRTQEEAEAAIQKHTEFWPEPFRTEMKNKSRIDRREVSKWETINR